MSADELTTAAAMAAAAWTFFHLARAALLCLANASAFSSAKREAWLWTRRAGEVATPHAFATWRLTRAAVLSGIALACAAIVGDRRWLAFAAVPAAYALWLWLRVRIPPDVLMLGASRMSTRSYFALRRSMRRGRLISLFQIVPAHAERLDNEAGYDCFRTTVTEDWSIAVENLIRVTPTVLVDLRMDSPHLRRELDMLRVGNHGAKALAIVGDDGDASIAAEHLPPYVPRVTEGEAARRLRERG